MTRKSKSIERKGDSDEMKEAIQRVKLAGLPLYRCSDHQLKSGHVNFWPSSGRISVDQMTKMSERGLDAFIDLAEKERARARGMPYAEFKL